MFRSLFLLLSVALYADIQVGDSVFSNSILEGNFTELKIESKSDFVKDVPSEVRCFIDRTTGIQFFFVSVSCEITQEEIEQHASFEQAKVIGVTKEDNNIFLNFFFQKRFTAHPNMVAAVRADVFKERTAIIYVGAIEEIKDEVNFMVRQFSVS